MNDLEEKLISGYLNDGFIYCILTNLHHTKDSKNHSKKIVQTK